MKKLFDSFVETVRSDWRDGKNAAERGDFEYAFFCFMCSILRVIIVEVITVTAVLAIVGLVANPFAALVISAILGLPAIVVWLIVRKS